MAGVIDEWVNRSGIAIDMMAHFDFGTDLHLDYSLGSLRIVSSAVDERFADPAEMLYADRQPEVEGMVAYVGECLLRLTRGRWEWDGATGFAERGIPAVTSPELVARLAAREWHFDGIEAPGIPVVQANPALGLAAVSPLHVLLAGSDAIVTAYEHWRRAVDAHLAAHPEWAEVSEPTLTDAMPIMPPSRVLDTWLAEQRRDFPHWADTYGGTWDYTPDSVDALAALVFRLTPTVAAFEDPAHQYFAEGASWYFGEMLCRARPARWMYRAHEREPGDPRTVCFTVQTNDNLDFTAPFIRISNMLRHGDIGRLRRGWDGWAENA